MDDESLCPGECDVCTDGTCTDDQSLCPGECDDCSNGTCVDDTSNCEDPVHFTCIDGDCVCTADEEWTAGDPIVAATIDYPEDGDVFGVGMIVPLSCSGASDPDYHGYCENNEWHEDYPEDSLVYEWTATAGTVTDSEGAEGSWTAPDTPGGATITVTVDDEDAEGRDDGEVATSVSVTVVKADLDIEGVDDADEEDPGGFVAVDDGLNIYLSAGPAVEGATVELETTASSGQIELYSDPELSVNIGLNPSWDSDAVPGTLYVKGISACSGPRQITLKLSYIADGSTRHSDTVKLTVVEVSLAVESNVAHGGGYECMEGRELTFTATASGGFPCGLTNPITFTFFSWGADGTIRTDSDWSTDRTEAHDWTVEDVLGGDADHKYLSHNTASASNDGAFAMSNDIPVDVYELWIEYLRDSGTGKDWKVVVNGSIAYSAIASAHCTSWEWDMEDGVPDVWNPTGGTSKTGTGMSIPNSDMPSSNSKFGDAYGTVNVYCEDADGSEHQFYSTSMNPSEKTRVFFDKSASTNPDGSVPNWYYYWKSGNVCGINSDVHYDAGGDFGYYIPGQDHVHVQDSAPTTNTGPETYTKVPGDSVTVTGQGVGIDCVAETIGHEKYHKYIYETYNGQADTDSDGIPDSIESTMDGINTFVHDPDSYNMGGHYSSYGDNELRCRKKELSPGIAVYPDRDWSEDGRQW